MLCFLAEALSYRKDDSCYLLRAQDRAHRSKPRMAQSPPCADALIFSSIVLVNIFATALLKKIVRFEHSNWKLSEKLWKNYKNYSTKMHLTKYMLNVIGLWPSAQAELS